MLKQKLKDNWKKIILIAAVALGPLDFEHILYHSDKLKECISYFTDAGVDGLDESTQDTKQLTN